MEMAAEGPRGWRYFFSEVAHYLSIREDTRSGTNELDLDRIKELIDVLRNIFKEIISNIFGLRVYREVIYD